MYHMRRSRQRDARKVQAEFFAHAQVHLVVHQPQRHLRWELLHLDAVELIDVDADELLHIDAELAGLVRGAQHVQFQQAQFAVADDQKIAAAAGRVKKRQPPQLLVKLGEPVLVAFDPRKLGPQRIQKQRLDQLEDVFLAGVMRAQVAPRLVVHDALEQAAENRRADRRPVQRARVKQRLAHGGAEVGHRQQLFKQLAVDVGKGSDLLVERLAAPGFGRVQRLKELAQPRAQVRAIGGGALFDKGAKRLRGLKNPGVVGKQAKQQPHQQHFQRMGGVAAGLERVVQPPHALGGADVDGVLRLDLQRFVARQKAENFDVLVQVLQRKFNGFASGQLMHPKARKVADDDELGQIALGNAGKVSQRLIQCGVEIFAARFLFDQQHAGPEQIDKAIGSGLRAGQLFDGVFKGGDALVGDAENLEKIQPERFALAVFAGRVGPSAAEGEGA